MTLNGRGRPLSDAALLRAWEVGAQRPWVERALVLLSTAYPDVEWDALARLPIGRREALLLDLRRATFGGRLTARADCPSCGDPLEIALDADDLLAGAAPPEPDRSEAEARYELVVDGWRLTFRLPNSLDIAAAAGAGSAAAARRTLIGRCVETVQAEGTGRRAAGSKSRAADPPPALTDAMLDALMAWMIACDPLMEIRLQMVCPACGHQWDTLLDVAAYVWTEIDVEARRLLRDVHRLAKAYHWREGDILQMSRLRRQSYLELLDG